MIKKLFRKKTTQSRPLNQPIRLTIEYEDMTLYVKTSHKMVPAYQQSMANDPKCRGYILGWPYGLDKQ